MRFYLQFLRLDYAVLWHDFVDDSIISQCHMMAHGLKQSSILCLLSAVGVGRHDQIQAKMTLRKGRRMAPNL